MACAAVVHDDRQRTPDAHEELPALAVCVLASDLLAGNVGDEEDTLGHEGYVPRDVGHRERSPEIVERAQRNERRAARQLAPVGRGGLDRRVRLGVHVADDARRVAHHDRARGNRVGHHRPGADHRVATDVDPRQDRAVGSEAGAGTDRGLERRRAVALAAGERIVCERRVRPDEDVVGDPQAVPELHAALHRDAVAKHDVVLDEDVVADVAVAADAGAGQHVSKGPDAGPRAYGLALAQPLRMHEHRHTGPTIAPGPPASAAGGVAPRAHRGRTRPGARAPRPPSPCSAR